MGETIRWVDRTADLQAVAAEIGAGPLALDTEADSFHHYPEKVCLVQLAYDGKDVVVDPLSGTDLAALKPVLEDRAVRKLVHGGDYDVRLLGRDWELALRNLFDTMIAARLIGEPAVGLATLVESRLGVRLDKSHQRADWSLRPLSPPMLAYAAADTRHLAELAAGLEEDLSRLGRLGWAEEEFARLESVRFKGAPEGDPEAFRRAKGSSALDRRSLAVLRALWAWREAEARRRDRPPFKVLREETVVDLARSRPSTRAALAAVKGVPDRLPGSRAGDALLETIAGALALDEEALPATRSSTRPRCDPEVERRALALKEGRDRVAKMLALDPSVVASRATLEAVATCLVRGEPPERATEMRAWQWELLRSFA